MPPVRLSPLGAGSAFRPARTNSVAISNSGASASYAAQRPLFSPAHRPCGARPQGHDACQADSARTGRTAEVRSRRWRISARRQRAQVRPQSDKPICLRDHDPGSVVVEPQAAFDGQIPVKEATRRLDLGEVARDIARSQNDHYSTIFENQTVSAGPLPGPATTTSSRKWLTNRLAVATASAASAADVTASGPVP